MTEKQNRSRRDQGRTLLLSIILVFCILGTVVFYVSQKIFAEMSSSAIYNLRESLTLIKGTVEAILTKEAEFQRLIAQEIAASQDPEEFVRSYRRNRTMVKMAIVMTGEMEGISSDGNVFLEE